MPMLNLKTEVPCGGKKKKKKKGKKGGPIM